MSEVIGPVKVKLASDTVAFDPVEAYKVTAKILSYIEGLSKKVNESCDQIKLI